MPTRKKKTSARKTARNPWKKESGKRFWRQVPEQPWIEVRDPQTVGFAQGMYGEYDPPTDEFEWKHDYDLWHQAGAAKRKRMSMQGFDPRSPVSGGYLSARQRRNPSGICPKCGSRPGQPHEEHCRYIAQFPKCDQCGGRGSHDPATCGYLYEHDRPIDYPRDVRRSEMSEFYDFPKPPRSNPFFSRSSSTCESCGQPSVMVCTWCKSSFCDDHCTHYPDNEPSDVCIDCDRTRVGG